MDQSEPHQAQAISKTNQSNTTGCEDTPSLNNSSASPRRDPSPEQKPAIFIAKKLFSDFILLANKKIRNITSQESLDKPIFKQLLRDQDLVYDQLLEAIGAISEFCLPSLLKASLSWYQAELGVDLDRNQKRSIFCDGSCQRDSVQTQVSGDASISLLSSIDRGSPCNDSIITSSGNNSLQIFRSPTPSSPEGHAPCNNNHHHAFCNQRSLSSALLLDHQTPSLPVIGEHQSSNPNTSTSTATNISSNNCSLNDETNGTQVKRLELSKTSNLLVEYIFCQLLLEIFNQLHLHPGHDDLIGQIEEIAFKHFKLRDPSEMNLDTLDLANINQLADKYAEVVGALARTRFRSVRKRFIGELNELKAKDLTQSNIQGIVNLLSGIKYFRVKMAPIEEFEASFHFLQELADYFLEVRHKSIKHALASLFVEILTPLALTAKNEVKIPCLKNFVETLWTQTWDMCSRKKHSLTLFPLVTCLLCMSQRSTFLANWGSFLSVCLSNLKNRDQKVCRIALESLYRLIWMYMIRVKCESNNITQTRLHSIVDAIFPRGSRAMVPRDAPLPMFVDMIYFIAQERLDFAMRQIIFDLLSVDRSYKVITAPERMNIAIQAFLVIVDGLQSKDNGDLLLSKTLISSDTRSTNMTCNESHIWCNSILERRLGASNKMLNDDIAKIIGIFPYYPHVQRSLGDILKALDNQCGKPFLMKAHPPAHHHHHHHKDSKDEVSISAEMRPKIALFKTCIIALPRLMPDGMSRGDLVDLMARMTIHLDAEMRRYSFESLLILLTEFADWRLDVIEGYTSFMANQSEDTRRRLKDICYGVLLQLLVGWHQAISIPPTGSAATTDNCDNQPVIGVDVSSLRGSLRSLGIRRDLSTSTMVSIQTGYETISSRSPSSGGQIAARKTRELAKMRLIQSELHNIKFERLLAVMQKVESLSLVLMYSCGFGSRRQASQLLRKSRAILKCYGSWTRMELEMLRGPALAAAAAANAAASAIIDATADATNSDDDATNDPEDEEEDEEDEDDDEEEEVGEQEDEEDLSASLRGSLSADNLSRITATGATGPLHSSCTSMQNSASTNKLCCGPSSSMDRHQNVPGGRRHKQAATGGLHEQLAENRKQRIRLSELNLEEGLLDCFEAADRATDQVGSPQSPCNHSRSSGDAMPANDGCCVSSIFWMALIMLESKQEQEFRFALRLVGKFLPNLPFDDPDFTNELNKNLNQMGWLHFPGVHKLIRRGCGSATNYELAMELLNQLTPRLRHPLCSGFQSDEVGELPAGSLFPLHAIVMLTQLLRDYEDPSPFSLNVARRLAIWCDEEAAPTIKLDNLSTVMTLYSRRCFSKDAFQWTKCVVKYLYDAYPEDLQLAIPQLIEILESGPQRVQRLVAPILYCILSYVDLNTSRCLPGSSQRLAAVGQIGASDGNKSSVNLELARLFGKLLGTSHWREAVQIFKLIISRSSHLATNSSFQFGGRELPGRTMDFEVENLGRVVQASAGQALAG